jgi:hypothetical protein
MVWKKRSHAMWLACELQSWRQKMDEIFQTLEKCLSRLFCVVHVRLQAAGKER